MSCAAGNTQVDSLVEELHSAPRRRRQEVAHELGLEAKENSERMAPHIKALIAALDVQEAQTRWEIFDILSLLVSEHAKELNAAKSHAELALFDDDSATVRLSAFVFLTKLAASSDRRSEAIWPLLDEAIQCFHGDAEYRDMLLVLRELAAGSAAKKIKAALSKRVQFDAENATGYVQSISAEIMKLCE